MHFMAATGRGSALSLGAWPLEDLVCILTLLPRAALLVLGQLSSHWRRASALARSRKLTDLSLGQEPAPISCVNTIDEEPFPDLCMYRNVNFASGTLALRLRRSEISPCVSSSLCDNRYDSASGCVKLCGSAAYTAHGELRALLHERPSDTPSQRHLHPPQPASVIFECSARCSCQKAFSELSSRQPFSQVPSGHLSRVACGNRVVGAGVRFRLQVRKTCHKGWSLHALEPIGRGRFVCEYAGEVLSSAEALRRSEHNRERGLDNYIMMVREHCGDGRVMRTTIDPSHTGNVGRFANHSCEPNLEIQLVRVGSMVPSVAFFAQRAVGAGEELTISDGELSEEGAAKPCRCGAPSCTGLLPFQAFV